MNNTINDPYYAVSHDDSDDEAVNDIPIATGKDRVIRLVLIALFFLVIAGVIIFGVLPYIEYLNQPTAPPLPPAIHA